MPGAGGEKAKGSIATSFILIVLVILVLGQGSLWLWFLSTQKENARDTLVDKVEMAAGFLSDVSAAAIVRKDSTGLTRYAQRMVADEDIISVKVLDPGGRVVVHVTEGAGKSPGWNIPFFVQGEDVLSLPVTAEGREVGNIEIAYSGQRANEFMLGLLTVPPAAQVFVFLVVIFAIYFVFQKKVGIPISDLQNSIREVTDGDLTVRIPEMESNELSDIADGLRFLVERLSSTIMRLNHTAEEVSGAIEYLNGTYSNSVNLIKKQAASLEDIAGSLEKTIESQKLITGSTEELTALSGENLASLLEVKATGDEIVSSMDGLFQAAENSYSIVAQMSQTAKVMNTGSQEVLASVQNTSASVEEILASIREVERNAKESSSIAETVRVEAAQRGVNTVAEAIKGMEKITEKVLFSVDVVRRLDARSKDVQRIISVIREVTEQTNLLSLNAAILAEQAGEYGKGFSVVADEMRALSSRTASYTREIAGIVKTIQIEIKDAVSSIDDGMRMVKEGSETVYRVGETMSSILDSSHESATMTKMIEKATEDQVKALRHIEASVTDINKMAMNMSKAMEEQHRGSDYMLQRVGEVREIAESTKKGTEEQASGTRAISKNLELANAKVSRINDSVISQQKDNYGLISAVEELKGTSGRMLKDVEGVSRSLSRLKEDIDQLKHEMETFRTR